MADENEPLFDVFISHKREDIEKVKYFVEGFKDLGLAIYCSSLEDRPSRKSFDVEITRILRESPICVGFQSPAAWQERWVRGEWSKALKQDKLFFARIALVDEDMITANFENEEVTDFSSDTPPYSGEKFRIFLETIRDEVEHLRKEREPTLSETKDGTREPADKSKTLEGQEPVTTVKSLPTLRSSRREKIDSILGRGETASKPLSANAALPSPGTEQKRAFAEDALPAAGEPLDLSLGDGAWCLWHAEDLVAKACQRHDPAIVHEYARRGQPDAQALVGLAQTLRDGPYPRDFEAAGRWLEKASSQNFPRAMAELAVMIASGSFAKKNVKRVDTLTTKAAEADCPRAKTLRALLRQTGTRLPSLTFADSLGLLEEAHRSGDALATTHLGWSLLQGRARKRDVPRGFEMLQDAARAKEPRAMTYLGVAYATGRGSGRSFSRAAHWFGRAADHGDLLGLVHLAWCNETGAGVARDAVEARKLYKRACDRGDGGAMLRLGKMYLSGRGGKIDRAKAFEMFKSAHALGETNATSRLGEMYEEGLGTERDLIRAAELYTQAAEQDHPWALWRLGHLREAGRGIERDREEAIELYRRAAINAADRQLLTMAIERLDQLGAPLRRAGR